MHVHCYLLMTCIAITTAYTIYKTTLQNNLLNNQIFLISLLIR